MSGYAWQDEALREDFRARVARHAAQLARRGRPLSAETVPPVGQAANWYWAAVAAGLPPSARAVARQLARLCGHEASVIVPWRSLADAVGIADRAGRPVAYTERGVRFLTETGWLEVEVSGRGRASRTRFAIAPGWGGWWDSGEPDEDDLEAVA